MGRPKKETFSSVIERQKFMRKINKSATKQIIDFGRLWVKWTKKHKK